MAASRLALALAAPELALPDQGTIGLFQPPADVDLAPLAAAGIDRLQAVQRDFSAHEALAGRGLEVTVRPEGPYAMSVVFLPRARDEAHALLAEAAARTPGGWVVVDGLKVDGVDSLLRRLRGHVGVTAPLAKAHGKAFAFRADEAAPFLARLAPAGRQQAAPGFVTAPGLFSADGVDPGSALLAEALPARPGPRVADLGAGWGWLAAQVLAREGVELVELVEADHLALECARANVADPRAVFTWADVAGWKASHPFDSVVTNPPFHRGRRGDPGLGHAFIAAAARNLKPSGSLWLVANRHLPYEHALRAHFRHVEELPGTAAYKLFHARRPVTGGRRQGGGRLRQRPRPGHG